MPSASLSAAAAARFAFRFLLTPESSTLTFLRDRDPPDARPWTDLTCHITRQRPEQRDEDRHAFSALRWPLARCATARLPATGCGHTHEPRPAPRRSVDGRQAAKAGSDTAATRTARITTRCSTTT